MIDINKRKFFKALTWKMVGVILISTIAYVVTGDIKTVGIITALYHVLTIALFMVHEKLWEKIKWGKTNGLFIQMSGMSGAGKTTLAKKVSERLSKKGILIEIIDGDEYRDEICKDLGFSRKDREENIKRLSFIGKVLGRNNVVCIMSAINPYDSSRKKIKESNKNSKLVFIKCGINRLIERDPKGLYARALLPKNDSNRINNFTGISDPYEAPVDADLIIDTESESVKESVKKLEKFILEQISHKH